ncbi:substrate-binding domain-containing protein [Methylocaldum sp. 14B]|uniref:substrate-binding domain-containing protein n=1 Tax=Methylocaldum sp. 14B TaxID=1912213 RepID=UPI00098B3BBE|nr:substrate-binding domain-containing protein [Methylocaldum sp. 14B]
MLRNRLVVLGLIASVVFTPLALAEQVLKMATTTSTENTGLLPVLNAPFEKKHKARIDVIAVGSGKAMKLGESGDVDIVFVHDPDAEEKFMAAGNGVDRKPVMHNDFVVVGPETDPAGVRNAKTTDEAFRKIAAAKAGFVSRGDESGTHVKEKTLWRKAGLRPEGEWYLSVGQGMGAVLRMADDKAYYALTDRGTFLASKDKLTVKLLFEGDPALFNPYHVMAVNPKKHKHVNYELAKKYIDYVTGTEGQKTIADFKVADQPLFYPDAISNAEKSKK